MKVLVSESVVVILFSKNCCVFCMHSKFVPLMLEIVAVKCGRGRIFDNDQVVYSALELHAHKPKYQDRSYVLFGQVCI